MHSLTYSVGSIWINFLSKKELFCWLIISNNSSKCISLRNLSGTVSFHNFDQNMWIPCTKSALCPQIMCLLTTQMLSEKENPLLIPRGRWTKFGTGKVGQECMMEIDGKPWWEASARWHETSPPRHLASQDSFQIFPSAPCWYLLTFGKFWDVLSFWIPSHHFSTVFTLWWMGM